MVGKLQPDLYLMFLDKLICCEKKIIFYQHNGVTMYAYADIFLPKQFDIAFQIDKPDNYSDTTFVINQAITNGWTSVNQIDHGHKHIVMIEFPNSVPGIFNLLPAFSDNGTTRNGAQ